MSKKIQLQEKEGMSCLNTFEEFIKNFTDEEQDNMQVSAGVLYRMVKELQTEIKSKTHPFVLVKFPLKDFRKSDGPNRFQNASNRILEILSDFGWGSIVLPDEVDKIEFHQFDVQGLEKLDVEELKKRVDKILENLV